MTSINNPLDARLRESMEHLPPVPSNPVPRNIELEYPVPSWAAWLAQDSDGLWCVYEGPAAPRADGGQWVPSSKDDRMVRLERMMKDKPNPDGWRDTLIDLTKENAT